MVSNLLEKLFRISEIRDSKILQIVALCIFFIFIISFSLWINSIPWDMICSPHITHCDFYKSILIFDGFPDSYDQSIFYIILLWVIFLWLYSLYIWEYGIVWWSLFLLSLYKWLYIYVFSAGNYDYYDIVLVLIFLFAHNKLYWLRIWYVLLYVLAATIKFHPGWILGTYFSALQTGLPLFPDISIPLWSNIAIITQIVLCWMLLLRKNTTFFLLAEIYFMSFHFYSGILVEYRYLLTTIPFMIVLFILPKDIPYKRSYNIFSYIFILLLFVGQSVAIMIPGDQKLTLEWNKYGLYMFEANHQCIATYSIIDATWAVTTTSRTSKLARDRCDPYDALKRYQPLCSKDGIERIAMTFDHSINGEPFYRIVDQRDICNLHYAAFTRNSWIKSEYDSPALIGYPVRNFYDGRIKTETNMPIVDGSLIRLPWLEHTDRVSMSIVQKILLPFVGNITILYWSIWIITLIIVLTIHIKRIVYLNKTHIKNKDIDLLSQ